MQTRMVRDGSRFTVGIQVPPGSELNFSFLISKTAEDKVVEMRQERDEEGRLLTKVAMLDGQIEVRSQWKERL